MGGSLAAMQSCKFDVLLLAAGLLTFTDKLEFHVAELPKLPKELKEDSDGIGCR